MLVQEYVHCVISSRSGLTQLLGFKVPEEQKPAAVVPSGGRGYSEPG